MNRRAKTRQRVLLLWLGMGTLVLAAMGVWRLAQDQLERRLLRSRTQGLAALAAGRPLDALVALNRYARYRSDDVEALYHLALARAQVPLPEGRQRLAAATLLRRVLDLAPQHEPAQRALLALCAQAGLDQEACHVAQSLLAAHPHDAALWRAHALALERLGRLDQALAAARTWRQVAPSSQTLDADLLLANLHLAADQPDAALDDLQPHLAPALDQPEAFAPILTAAARSLLRLAQSDETSAALNQRLARSPACRMLWISLLGAGAPTPSQAVAHLRQAAAAWPDASPPELLALARAWFQVAQRGSPAEQTQWRRQALDHAHHLAQRLHPDALALAALANLVETEGDDLDLAETLYRQALRLSPSEPVVCNNLALLILRRGDRLPEALQLVRQAVQVQPHCAQYQDSLASVQAHLGDYDAALTSLNQAVQLEPANPTWQVNLAAVLVRSGHREQARQLVSRLETTIDPLRLAPGPRQRLAQLRTELAQAPPRHPEQAFP